MYSREKPSTPHYSLLQITDSLIGIQRNISSRLPFPGNIVDGCHIPGILSRRHIKIFHFLYVTGTQTLHFPIVHFTTVDVECYGSSHRCHNSLLAIYVYTRNHQVTEQIVACKGMLHLLLIRNNQHPVLLTDKGRTFHLYLTKQYTVFLQVHNRKYLFRVPTANG